ncbi:hypothetical protein JQM60_09020 [Butyricicoccus pullicaecorum]|nr:hypothetical protein [Butyricicoccus pullicaecorum]
MKRNHTMRLAAAIMFFTGLCASGASVVIAAAHQDAFSHVKIARMEVFEPDVLEAWYAYFSTGDPQYFYQLMQKSS